MRKFLNIAGLLLLFAGTLFAQEYLSEYEQNWPQWRGPNASGVAPLGNPPSEWNEQMNIKWKAEIPGIGHATPIIWKDQIILLSALPTERKAEIEEPDKDQGRNNWMSPIKTEYIHEFVVMSVDRNNGKIDWQTTVREELPHSHTHQFGSWASNSPVTDGASIYAYFGSHGLYCLNLKGEVQWERDFGPMEKVMSFGEGSSPALYEDKLIILRDHQGQSTLHVLDKHSGEIIWEVERDEVSSWATPYVIEFEGKTQLITSATNKIRSYNLENGELIWEFTGLTRNVIPTPVSANGMVYLMSGFRGNALFAINLSKAKGDLSDSDAIVWQYDKNTPYTPSPVLMDDKLYFLKVNNGYLSCLDAKDGKEYYTNQKLEGVKEIFTSPVGVNDRIYITGTNGTFCVVKHGESFELLSQNTLEDSFYASPVIIGDRLYLRGVRYLYCVSEEE
ncbi:MAG: PQQ-binding-like beta-propeller repeat protein [Bacteroidota bacterium]